jgi:hypothetical protein
MDTENLTGLIEITRPIMICLSGPLTPSDLAAAYAAC